MARLYDTHTGLWDLLSVPEVLKVWVSLPHDPFGFNVSRVILNKPGFPCCDHAGLVWLADGPGEGGSFAVPAYPGGCVGRRALRPTPSF